MLKSVHILLAIACYCDKEICQLDVNTSFLNGIISENILTEQLGSFVTKGQENLLYKLKKSIMGLSKHQGHGTYFDENIKAYDFI